MQKVDTDTATVVGLWAGVGGVVVGFAGIGLTLYSFYKDKPSEVILTGSGWAAALLCAVAFGYIGKQFVRLAAQLSNRVAELQAKLAEQILVNQRLIEIDAYVISSRGRTRESLHNPFPARRAVCCSRCCVGEDAGTLIIVLFEPVATRV